MPVGCEASRANHGGTCAAARVGSASTSEGMGPREGAGTSEDVGVARTPAHLGASARADEPAKHNKASTVMVCGRIANLHFFKGRGCPIVFVF
jgi:hypothetical protein